MSSTFTRSIIRIFPKINVCNHALKQTKHITAISSIRFNSTNADATPLENDKNLNDTNANIENAKESPFLSNKTKLLQASLEHVPSLGWTEAIYAVKNIPPSTIGLLSSNPSNDLIVYHMDQSNKELELELQHPSDDPVNIQIEKAIKLRLSKNTKLIESKRWHEAMANGILHNPTTTLNQLNDIVSIILTSCSIPNDLSKERVAVGIVYITTELYMLTDTSIDYEDTWRFLKEQMNQLDHFKNVGFVPSGESLVLMSAVVSSIGGAIVSLVSNGLFKNVGYGGMLSFIMSFAQQTSAANSQTNTTSDLKYYNEKYGDLKDVDTKKKK